MFDYLCYFQTSTFVINRLLFLDVPFLKGQPFYQDIDWFLRVDQLPDTRLVIVDEPLTVYYEPRRRVTVTSKTPWKARLDWGKANRHRMSRKSLLPLCRGILCGACGRRRRRAFWVCSAPAGVYCQGVELVLCSQSF